MLLLDYHFREQELRKQNRQFLIEYSNLFIQLNRSDSASERGNTFDVEPFLQVELIQLACSYLNNHLVSQFSKSPQQYCQSSAEKEALLRSTGTLVYNAFITPTGERGLLILMAARADLNPFVHISLALIMLIFLATGGLGLRRYLKKREAILGLDYLEDLEHLCRNIVYEKDYKQRAGNTPPRQLKTIVAALNTMLDDLQNNEIHLQENAIQIQEKTDQLESQRKLHLDRNQNLQKMFAGASHDLRQPLQAMTIFISAIKETATTQQEPMINKLEQVLDNLNHLFTDLLDISKIESRMQRIPKRNIEIRPLLAKIFDEFEALANEKQIEFRLFQRDLIVYSNPNMLERIIRNMISNAIRYTRTGGVLIGSRKRRNAVWIEVWDTGRGIPKNKMSEIFNEFVQIKDKDSEPNKGVGLGLFIVKRLAQLLDHSIMVTSKLRRGTMFRVVVPGHDLYLIQPNHTLITNDKQPVQLPYKTTALKIAFVDDDDVIRENICGLFRSWQYEVVEFRSIEDIEQSTELQSGNFDLILSDFQLSPNTTGLNAIESLRHRLGRMVPAIIISGTQDPIHLQTINDSGIPWLRKPVKPAKLRALINIVCQPQKPSG